MPSAWYAWLLLWLLALAASAPRAQTMDTPAPAASAPASRGAVAGSGDNTVWLNNRRIVTFRGTLLGDTPAERADLARAAIEAAAAARSPGIVTRVATGEAMRFDIDDTTAFFQVAADLTGPRPALMLEAASQETEQRLRLALAEAREMNDPRRLAIGAAWSAGALVLAYALGRLLFALRRHGVARLDQRLADLRLQSPQARLLDTYADHARSGARLVTTAAAWLLVLLLADVLVTFVLHQFAYTRPWGERATAWLVDLLQQFALAAAGAVPGLLTAVLIFAIARLVSRANTLFMQRVERGEVRAGWLDIDTAGPTRRLANVAIWLFALAMAYPYLPGANSEAFKGVSVLAGLMLSLGASGVVGQATAGLSLMYARALRVGEYVRIGETEGTVAAIGLFATKIHTGMGEEVSLPNAVVLSQSVRNYSRLVEHDGQFMLHTAVTIGYATPWRQVHAMLLEAARRTPGVATTPAPYVVQTALSDFYVEYRLCAQGSKSAPRRRAEAMNQLHGHIQDVFNENGVQIMSPHYRSDPPQPQVVAPEGWEVPLAARAGTSPR